jgi:hypothetical protein
MPPTVTALSPEKPGFVGAMRFDDPDEGTKNLAGFARKIVRDDPVAKAEIAALAADDPVRLAIETLCKDSGFESFAKHFDDAEFDKKWDRIRSRKAAIEKALAEIMKSK